MALLCCNVPTPHRVHVELVSLGSSGPATRRYGHPICVCEVQPGSRTGVRVVLMLSDLKILSRLEVNTRVSLPFGEHHAQVPGLLGDPCASWTGG